MIFNNVSDFMMVSFATEKATGSAIFDLPFWIIENYTISLKTCVLNRKPESKNINKI